MPQINIATDNGQIDAKEYEGKIYNITKTIVVEGEKNSRTSKSRGDGNQLFCLGNVRNNSNYSTLFELSHGCAIVYSVCGGNYRNCYYRSVLWKQKCKGNIW